MTGQNNENETCAVPTSNNDRADTKSVTEASDRENAKPEGVEGTDKTSPTSPADGAASEKTGGTISRRSALGGLLATGGVVVGAAAGIFGSSKYWKAEAVETANPTMHKEPFFGPNQAGIVTDTQLQVLVAGFDLRTEKREKVIELLKAWSKLSAALCQGKSVKVSQVVDADIAKNYSDTTAQASVEDSLEAWMIAPARLTITIGFGPTLFEKDGKDRYGIKDKRPEALVDLPFFPGEQLQKEHSNGDLILQICADDPQVVFHALRSLVRVAPDMAPLRWTQVGFSPSNTGGTPRNLMGFKDGTVNSNAYPPKDLNATVWVGDEGPAWMAGGSYGVYRRIRMSLEHWDRLHHTDQEQVFGRTKVTGVPLGGKDEFETIDFNKKKADGSPEIPLNAHIRLSSPEDNGGAVILRRSFSYNNGTTNFIERWPPWRQGIEYDAGLVFLAYQKDPRKAFIPINKKLALSDALNQFITHNASAIFAVPPGMKDENDWIGRTLFG